MSENNQVDQEIEPYIVIQKLRRVILLQRQTLQEDNLAFDSFSEEKCTLLSEINDQKRTIQHLERLLNQQMEHKKESNFELQQMKHQLNMMRKKNNQIKLSPSVASFKANLSKDITKRHIDVKSPEGLVALKSEVQLEFVPGEVKFSSTKSNTRIVSTESQRNATGSDNGCFGENFIEDFMVFGPNVTAFKKDKNRMNKDTCCLDPHCIFSVNKSFKNEKPQFLKEITRRVFPMGIEAKKRVVENIEDIREELEFTPSKKMSESYFVFTLEGDKDLVSMNKGLLSQVNPNQWLFVFCLKLPDFISIQDEKHYQRQEKEIWMIEKVYAIVTYYPFFNIHISILERIEAIIQSNRIYHIIVQHESFLLWQFSRNAFDVQKNETIRDLIAHFQNKKADYNKICYADNSYFGTIPDIGFHSQLAVAKFCCGAFFSTFPYEEMLLLITAIFCEKTLVFLSRSESLATLCSLFLISIMEPFKYKYPVLLNCDYEKMKMIFECPMPMVASIKSNKQNINDVLTLFAEYNVLRFRGKNESTQCILVDIDSDTILYDSDYLFEELIFSPSKKIEQAYQAVNSCESSSFSLPRNLPMQTVKPRERPKNNYEKNQQEAQKYIKEYKQKMETNRSRMPTFSYSPEAQVVLKMLSEYIGSFAIDRYLNEDLISRKTQKAKLEFVRKHLLEKHPEKEKLVEVIIKSQIYADYMGSLI